MTIPFPKDSFRVEILTRDKKNNFIKHFEYSSSPNNYFIKKSTNKRLIILKCIIRVIPTKN